MTYVTVNLTFCYMFTPVASKTAFVHSLTNTGARMNVLIVESRAELGALWKRHLERHGTIVTLVHSQDDAIERLGVDSFNIIILDLVLEGGSALAVADFASFRHPETRVIFVTNTSFFSDGSIFQHCANACAFLPSATAPADLAAMVEHYATPPESRRRNTN